MQKQQLHRQMTSSPGLGLTTHQCQWDLGQTPTLPASPDGHALAPTLTHQRCPSGRTLQGPIPSRGTGDPLGPTGTVSPTTRVRLAAASGPCSLPRCRDEPSPCSGPATRPRLCRQHLPRDRQHRDGRGFQQKQGFVQGPEPPQGPTVAAPDAAGAGPRASPARVTPGRAEGLNPGGNRSPPSSSSHTHRFELSPGRRGLSCRQLLRKRAGEKQAAGRREPGGKRGHRPPRETPSPARAPFSPREHGWEPGPGAAGTIELGPIPSAVETRSCRGPPAPKAELRLLPPSGDPRESVPGKSPGPSRAPAGDPAPGRGEESEPLPRGCQRRQGRQGSGGSSRSPAAGKAGGQQPARRPPPVTRGSRQEPPAESRGVRPREGSGQHRAAWGERQGPHRHAGSCPQAGRGPQLRAAPDGRRPAPPLPHRSPRSRTGASERGEKGGNGRGLPHGSPGLPRFPSPGPVRGPRGRPGRPPRAGTVTAAAGAAPEEPRGDGTPGYSGTLAPARSTGGETRRRRHREQPWRGSGPSTVPGLPETGPRVPGPAGPPLARDPGAGTPLPAGPGPAPAAAALPPPVPRRRRPLAAAAAGGGVEAEGRPRTCLARWRPLAAAERHRGPLRAVTGETVMAPGRDPPGRSATPVPPSPHNAVASPPGYSPTCLPITCLRLPLLCQ
ncbi:collagen, type I, alpha 1a-like [Haliaeetus albicilla]|uniref:collagen, type I, alpha 1a-like n=1 Tax=Haliaeetus albicilla TaxID=8969 RepID=UPI0037E9A814